MAYYALIETKRGGGLNKMINREQAETLKSLINNVLGSQYKCNKWALVGDENYSELDWNEAIHHKHELHSFIKEITNEN